MAVAARVLAIPPDNAYVRAACPPEALVSVDLSIREARGWDLHPAFAPGWLGRHRAVVDAVHLHFGFERLALTQLATWLSELHACGIPLVLTVHDLANPHLSDQAHHRAQLRLLLSAAARVITLTPGAASELAARYGAHAEVLAHPGVITSGPRRSQHPPTVGVHLKARAQVVDPDAIVAAVLAGAESRGARLLVDAQPALLDQLVETRSAAAEGRLELRTAGYLEDAGFASYLAGLDVSVLPYRFGTHSGWLEACRDVGTAVVAPDCGYYAEQWDQVVTYSGDRSLTSAVAEALSRAPAAPADHRWRAAQRAETRSAHAGVYAELLDERVAA